MPTAHPRYTVTDTGEVRRLIDAAAVAWPDVEDRKALLLRLAAAGRDALTETAIVDRKARINRQRAALADVVDLVDMDVLLGDDAWR